MIVLSLFPGIGLLDRAFEEEGFCIVRGPDLLWGGDIKRFHPPAGVFDGVLGGPPCQAHSSLVALNRAQGNRVAEDLIPEFERCVAEAAPRWFVMENVIGAPAARVPGYRVHAPLMNNRWFGGVQNRVHRFSFGTHDGLELRFEKMAEPEEYMPRVTTSNGGNRRTARKLQGGHIRKYSIAEMRELQGVPENWDPPFTVEAQRKVLGNAVPMWLGRALARAVREALGDAHNMCG